MIKVEKLTFKYKEKDIFKRLKTGKYKRGIENISFEVKKGEIFSIIGLNGAGKTSTMKIILGLMKADSGSVKIFNKKKLEKKEYSKIGYLPEISYYPKMMKLKELMFYYCELYGMNKIEAKQKSKEVLEELEIYDRWDERLEGFSKGMLQKVGLAQAIVNKPELLFLDEPMSGLDPLARKKIVILIKKLKENGTTIIFNTHILGDVAELGDRIAIIDDGKLIEVLDMKEKLNEENESNILIYKEKNGIQKKKEIITKKLNERIKELQIEDAEILNVEKNKFSLQEYFVEKVGGR